MKSTAAICWPGAASRRASSGSGGLQRAEPAGLLCACACARARVRVCEPGRPEARATLLIPPLPFVLSGSIMKGMLRRLLPPSERWRGSCKVTRAQVSLFYFSFGRRCEPRDTSGFRSGLFDGGFRIGLIRVKKMGKVEASQVNE